MCHCDGRFLKQLYFDYICFIKLNEHQEFNKKEKNSTPGKFQMLPLCSCGRIANSETL